MRKTVSVFIRGKLNVLGASTASTINLIKFPLKGWTHSDLGLFWADFKELVVFARLFSAKLRLRFGGAPHRILLHTPDVPQAYLQALTAAGWTCRQARGFE